MKRTCAIIHNSIIKVRNKSSKRAFHIPNNVLAYFMEANFAFIFFLGFFEIFHSSRKCVGTTERIKIVLA